MGDDTARPDDPPIHSGTAWPLLDACAPISDLYIHIIAQSGMNIYILTCTVHYLSCFKSVCELKKIRLRSTSPQYITKLGRVTAAQYYVMALAIQHHYHTFTTSYVQCTCRH